MFAFNASAAVFAVILDELLATFDVTVAKLAALAFELILLDKLVVSNVFAANCVGVT